MQKNILIAIFTALIVVILAIFVLLLDVEKKDDVLEIVDKSLPKISATSEKKNKKNEYYNKDYFFPVDVLYVKIDLKEKEQIKLNAKKNKPKQNTFQLIVNKKDRYSLFCIKHTLNSFSLPYVIINENGGNKIMLDSYDENILEQISKKLEQYDIKSEIKRLNV